MIGTPSSRSRLAPLLPALALVFSGCIYAVKPSDRPENKPVASSMPLRVAVSSDDKPNKWDNRPIKSGLDAFITALLHTGLFRDVRAASPGTPGFDLSVKVTSKVSRSNRVFFPFFLPLCDPLIIGCLPLYPLSENFTTEMQAVVSSGKSYTGMGLAVLTCQGPLGCAPASAGDPLARSQSVDDAANKIAADFVNDAALYRGMAQAVADREAREARDSREYRESAPSSSSTSEPAAPAQKQWWQ